MERGFKELRALNYKLEDVRHFKERHLMVLAQAWEAKGLSASTIQNRISVFRTFAEWIGKPGMILSSENYVKNPESVTRHCVAQWDKTWSGQQKRSNGDIGGFTPARPACRPATGIATRFWFADARSGLIKSVFRRIKALI